LAERFPSTLQTQGVGIPWHPDSAMYVHTEKGVSMDELYVNMVSAARLLNHFGVAVQMRPSKVNAIFGNGVWAWTDEELETFLEGGLWLDAEAAAIMQERGFDQWTGVEIEGWWDREEFNYSMEKAANPACGLPKGFRMNSNRFKRVARLQPTPQATEWTSLITAEGKRCSAALTVFQNDLGGRIAVSAFPLGSEENAWTKSFHRQILLQKLVEFLAGSDFKPVMVTGGAYLMPIDFIGDGRRVVILNGSADSSSPIARIQGSKHIKETYILRPMAKPEPVSAKQTSWNGGITVELEDEVPYLGMAVLIEK